MKKKQIRSTVCGVILAAAAISAAVGIRGYLLQKQAGYEYESIREEAGSGMPGENHAAAPSADIPIDFETLRERNPDVYAWITVPGTAVDYPVLQSASDNSYYLTHTIDGEKKPEGAIFTETDNRKDFEDPNTVIYGHDMKNGSMFHSLHNFMDREFFDSNRDVIIYTQDAVRHYRIFAAYLSDDRHILRSRDFSDPDVYGQYLEQVYAMRDIRSFVDPDTAAGVDDRIITLSTCYGTRHDVRYLVQAVLVSIDQ